MKLSRRSFLIGSTAVPLSLVHGCGGASPDASSGVTVVPAASPTPAPASPPTPSPSPAPTPTPAAVALRGIVVQAGDSIGVGVGAGDYAAIDHLGFPDSVAVRNASESGRTMQGGFAARSELFALYDATRPSILVIQQGTNDLGNAGRSAESLYGDIATPFVAAARAAGFYVVLTTLLPRSGFNWDAGKELERLSYNRSVRANQAGADAINDWAADPVMGDGVNPASPYFVDALHPSLAGQQRLSVLDATVLRPLLAREPRAPT